MCIRDSRGGPRPVLPLARRAQIDEGEGIGHVLVLGYREDEGVGFPGDRGLRRSRGGEMSPALPLGVGVMERAIDLAGSGRLYEPDPARSIARSITPTPR